MNNVIKIALDNKIYNIEAILNACYTFIERAYIFLDSDSQGRKITVLMKSKQNFSPKKIERLKGEFMNELLHNALRYTISKNNKKLREYIVGRALYSALPASEVASSEEKLDYIEDPLGIAVPWEEKYGKKKRKNIRAKI